jgi:hypothetical protein
VLRIIFGPKKVEVTEGWEKLPNDELHYKKNDQVKEDEMGRPYSTNWRE